MDGTLRSEETAPRADHRGGVAQELLRSANLVSVFDFLTPILTVGKDVLRGEAMPLVERDIAAFNHVPGPTATFDADAFDAFDAFDAAPRLAVRAADDTLDLTPVARGFDRLLRSRGLRDAGLDDSSAARRWNARTNLADTVDPMVNPFPSSAWP